MIHSDGSETRVRWSEDNWHNIVCAIEPPLAIDVTPDTVDSAQRKIFPPDRHCKRSLLRAKLSTKTAVDAVLNYFALPPEFRIPTPDVPVRAPNERVNWTDDEWHAIGETVLAIRPENDTRPISTVVWHVSCAILSLDRMRGRVSLDGRDDAYYLARFAEAADAVKRAAAEQQSKRDEVKPEPTPTQSDNVTHTEPAFTLSQETGDVEPLTPDPLPLAVIPAAVMAPAPTETAPAAPQTVPPSQSPVVETLGALTALQQFARGFAGMVDGLVESVQREQAEQRAEFERRMQAALDAQRANMVRDVALYLGKAIDARVHHAIERELGGPVTNEAPPPVPLPTSANGSAHTNGHANGNGSKVFEFTDDRKIEPEEPETEEDRLARRKAEALNDSRIHLDRREESNTLAKLTPAYVAARERFKVDAVGFSPTIAKEVAAKLGRDADVRFVDMRRGGWEPRGRVIVCKGMSPVFKMKAADSEVKVVNNGSAFQVVNAVREWMQASAH